MTTRTMPDALLDETSSLVAARLGLHFPPNRWADLGRGLEAAAPLLGQKDASSCAAWLLASSPTQREIEVLAAHLTVGETHFFRDANVFAALENYVLPALIEGRRGERRLRFWSAGCATGEEPYSLAILLDRLVPRVKDWNVSVLASDINATALEKAKAGIYGDWSFRGTPGWVKTAHFQQRSGGRYQLSARIRRAVSFAYLNLADDTYPSLATNTNAMDIVFCRNVLMYFSPERARRVVEKLHRAVLDGGWLIVSPSELSQSLFSGFTAVHCNGAILYRKAAEQEARAPASFPFEAKEDDWRLPSPAALPAWEPAPSENPTKGTDPPAPPPVAPVAGDAGPDGCYERALTLYRSGRYAEAGPILATLLRAGHGQADAAAAALLARVCANEGKLADALRWCDRALACDKMQAPSHYLRAVILEESGQTEEAVVALRRALYLDQSFVLAHITLSGIAGRSGNQHECKRHRRAALSLLQNCRADEVVPESEGITAGRLVDILGNQERFA